MLLPPIVVPVLHATLRSLYPLLAAAYWAGPLPGQEPARPRIPLRKDPVPAADFDTVPPALSREFRGVWIATVGNMNWPSRPGLSADQQREELRAILDRASALRLNALIFQVRPAGDALYASTVEPWSEVLTGRMGRSPGWDPLAFAVQEAHRRGLELHAWFNPFRASTPQMRSPVASRHVIRARPQWVRQYGRHRWMDPGEPAVRRHAIRVVLDVLRRYDVDGIHLDDYFYPYLENDRASGRVIQFPDAATYRRYRRSGGRLTRADWRRENVNTFVRELYQAIRREKPWVKFGVSPFGIWRPGHPPGVQGLDAYSEIYADARTWVRNGWLDYVVPQLYWSLDKPQQPYIPLMSWWAAQNSRGRHLWIGNYTDRVRNGDPRANWPAEEILQQVAHTRGPYGASGNVHFSMSVFMQNRDRIVERLTEQLYAEPALVPPSPWLDSEPPPAPRAALARGAPGLAVRLTPATGEPVRFWVVRTRDQAGWATAVVGAEERTVVVGRPGEPSPAAVAVSAVDRVGNESAPVILVLRRTLRWPTAPMSP